MIQPLKYNNNISFKANEQKNTNTEDKPSLKKRFVNVIKGVNDITSTTKGVTRGITEGIAATAIIGLVGKNIKETNANIFKTALGIIKDTAKATWSTAKFIPQILTKAPVENLKDISALPVKFYKDYLKNNKTTASIATFAGLGVLALRTIQGKIKANLKNANVDHATKTEHY